MDKEIWKDIPNYKGYYKVSNFGRVKSLDHYVEGKNGSNRHIHGKILSATNDNRGYLKVALQTNKRSSRKLFKVHRLVMISFKKEPSKTYDIDHIDGNKQNNHLTNLEFVTKKINIQRAIKNSLQDRSKGSKKTKVAMLDEDGNVLKKFSSISSANKILGYPLKGSGISDVINGRQKTYFGKYWKKI